MEGTCMKTIHVEIGVGELADRLTILELKKRHAHSRQQRGRVERELARLRQVRAQAGLASPVLEREIETLRAINRRLWEVEDQIRVCEQRRDLNSDQVVEDAGRGGRQESIDVEEHAQGSYDEAND